MGQIATLLGKTADATNYNVSYLSLDPSHTLTIIYIQNIAASYVAQWQKYATASTGDHLSLSYGQDSTWGLTYNLYGDKLLKLNLFPTSVYQMQTAWYSLHASECCTALPLFTQSLIVLSMKDQYGVLLDTRNTWTKSGKPTVLLEPRSFTETLSIFQTGNASPPQL